MTDADLAALRQWAEQHAPCGHVQARQVLMLLEERERFRAALASVCESYECHCYVRAPKPESEMDEYDLMMRPKWEEAAKVLKQE